MEKRRLSPVDQVVAALLGMTILVVLAQVIWRYILNDSLTWTEELSSYLFAWTVFLGAALAIRDDLHVRFTFLSDRFSTHTRRVAEIVKSLLIGIFLLSTTIFGVMWVIEVQGTRSPALGLPVNFCLYGAVPAASVIGLYFLVQKVLRRENLRRTSKDERDVGRR